MNNSDNENKTITEKFNSLPILSQVLITLFGFIFMIGLYSLANYIWSHAVGSRGVNTSFVTDNVTSGSSYPSYSSSYSGPIRQTKNRYIPGVVWRPLLMIFTFTLIILFFVNMNYLMETLVNINSITNSNNNKNTSTTNKNTNSNKNTSTNKNTNTSTNKNTNTSTTNSNKNTNTSTTNSTNNNVSTEGFNNFYNVSDILKKDISKLNVKLDF